LATPTTTASELAFAPSHSTPMPEEQQSTPHLLTSKQLENDGIHEVELHETEICRRF
jgi:hypothetical protein